MNPKEAELNEIRDMLIDSNMFNRLKAAEYRSAAPYFGINNYREGETIFKEGDKGTFMCIVMAGRVSVIKSDMDGNDVVMGIEGVGHVFGEMAVLDSEPRSATCAAKTHCQLLTLAKTSMDAMIVEQPHIGAEVIRSIAINLSHRMRFAAGRLVDRLEQD